MAEKKCGLYPGKYGSWYNIVAIIPGSIPLTDEYPSEACQGYPIKREIFEIEPASSEVPVLKMENSFEGKYMYR